LHPEEWACGNRCGQSCNLTGVGHVKSENLDTVENARCLCGNLQLAATPKVAHGGQHLPSAPGKSYSGQQPKALMRR